MVAQCISGKIMYSAIRTQEDSVETKNLPGCKLKTSAFFCNLYFYEI